MNWLQQHTLELLQEIDAICQANGIPYYLAAGTMIGAIRHGGFIPWDDDADVYIRRSDWARFVRAFDARPVPNRVLVDPWRVPAAQYPVHRYVDVSTTEIYRMHIASPQPTGVMVDFLILDDIPDDAEAQAEHVRLMTEWGNVLTRCTQFTRACPSAIDMDAVWKRVKKEGRAKVLAEYEERLFSYPENMCHHLVQCDPGVPHVWDESVFKEPRYVLFEGTKLPVATNVHAALTGAFNEDWMGVPAAASRETHIQASDAVYPSKRIFDDASRFIPRGLYESVVTHRNKYLSRIAQRKHALEARMTTFADEYVAMRYEEVATEEITRWIAEAQYNKLDEFYSSYLSYQCDKMHIGSPSYAGWFRAHYPLYINLGDEFLQGALISLIHQRRISAARIVLLARKQVLGVYGDQLQEIEKECSTTKELIGKFLMGETLDAPELDGMCASYPYNPYLRELALLARFGKNAEVLDEAQQMLELFPHNAWARFIEAESLRARGSLDEARSSYSALFSCDKNGLVFKELFERSQKRLKKHENTLDSILMSAASAMLAAHPERARVLVSALCLEEDRKPSCIL